MKRSYLLKIVPPLGYRVFRLEFTRSHVVFAAILSLLVAGGLAAYGVRTVHHAEASAQALRALTGDQRLRLEKIGAQAAELDGKLRQLERQNAQIRSLMGQKERTPASAAAPPAPLRDRAESFRASDDFAAVAARIERLRVASFRASSDENRLHGLALRVLSVRRLQDLARTRVLAAIPSVNPAGPGVAIRSAYGWRSDPWPEFHRGVDLDVDYGDPVRSAAAGTVVAAGYDGGYGYKIDIDHGNGYHTWYCHLSRIDVLPGRPVGKGEHIGLVGSTGASTGPHLHYQIMLDGASVDPTPYLAGVPAHVLASLR